MTEREKLEFDKAAGKTSNNWYFDLSGSEIQELRRMCNTVYRPRKHVDSKVIEPKQIEGEK